MHPETIIWNELVTILERNVRQLDLMRYVLPAKTFSPIVWREVPDYVGAEEIVHSRRSMRSICTTKCGVATNSTRRDLSASIGYQRAVPAGRHRGRRLLDCDAADDPAAPARAS